MAWTNMQKQLAIRACKEAGLNEDQRRDVLLRQFKNAHHGGDISSTSPLLTSGDFEAFMAIVEGYKGGKVLHYEEGFWKRAAMNGLCRMRGRAVRIGNALESVGLLAAGGVGLAGWIEKRVSGGAATRVEQLNYHGLLALLLGLQAYAKANNVPID